MNREFLIFTNFLWRDLFTYLKSKQIKRYIINYSLIYPTLFSISYGYIIPNTCFDPSKLPATAVMLTGTIISAILSLVIATNIFMLVDLESDQFTKYQATVLRPNLLVLEKIVFSSLFSFFLLLPFFVISKLLLFKSFDTTHLSIIKFLIVLYLSTLAVSSYALLAMLNMSGTHVMGRWWRRFNFPLVMLGGAWVPWMFMQKASPLLAYIILVNPFLYITEGIRGAILGNGIYIPFIYCVSALSFATIIFTYFSFVSFKKRIDHI